MSWRDELRPASFRGVPFFVRTHEAGLGRRVQVHEYPLRDKPWAEDLGRKARALTVEAYVLGPDYMAARNSLVRAIEQAGAGQLVHPYLGELRCTVVSCKLREGSDEGGSARFSLEFVEAGDATFPTNEASTTAAVAATADYAAAAVRSNFERRHRVANKPAFVAAASQNIFNQAVNGYKAAVKSVRAASKAVAALNRDITAAQRDVVTVLFNPASAAQALAGGLRQLVRNVTVAPREQLKLAQLFYRFGSLLPPVVASTTSRRQQATNQTEMLRLVRVTAAAEGALAASAVQFDSYQDAISVRDELVATLDDAMLTGADDASYDAMRALRAATVRDITARGANLARLVTWTPGVTMPSLAAAQRLYADATREPELLARNRVRHPLFLQGAQPLEVLSDGA